MDQKIYKFFHLNNSAIIEVLVFSCFTVGKHKMNVFYVFNEFINNSFPSLTSFST